jgi:hypothetical protein
LVFTTEWRVSDGGTHKGDRGERSAPYIENVDGNAYGAPELKRRTGTFWQLVAPVLGAPAFERGILTGPVKLDINAVSMLTWTL